MMSSQTDFNKLSVDALNASQKYFKASTDEIRKLLISNKGPLDGISPLASFVVDRIATCLHLTEIGKLWDAEIIFRSAIEVFAKLLIITRQTSNEKVTEKLEEYWIHINEIEKHRQSQEIERLLAAKNVSNPERFEDMVLPKEEMIKIESEYPKNRRKVLRENWSFNKMYFDLSNIKNLDAFVPMEMLHFFWKMSSHLAHGDKIGVNTVLLRAKVNTLKPHNDFTQAMKLLNAAVMINIWVLAELAIFVKDNEAHDLARTMHDEFGLIMSVMHKSVLEEAYRIEDEFIKSREDSREN